MAQRRCGPSSSAAGSLPAEEVDALLREIPEWRRDGGSIVRTYRFPDYAQTMAFANAIAWIAQREDHHPDVAIGYDTCRAAYSTHAVGGLTENDFICAAKLDVLFAL